MESGFKSEDYIHELESHLLPSAKKIRGKDYIFQQDNATPHTHHESLAWCEANFKQFISTDRWPANSPDLNVLDYYVWDAITNHMQWSNVKNYDSLIDEIKKGIRRVPTDELARSVESWSQRILSILKTKGVHIK